MNAPQSTIDQQAQWITTLSFLLPFAFAWLARTLAGFISQDKWPQWINELIVAGFSILAAILDLYTTGRLTGDLTIIIGNLTATLTFLLATYFKPLQRWSDILQSSIFVVQNGKLSLFSPPEEKVGTPKPIKPLIIGIPQEGDQSKIKTNVLPPIIDPKPVILPRVKLPSNMPAKKEPLEGNKEEGKNASE